MQSTKATWPIENLRELMTASSQVRKWVAELDIPLPIECYKTLSDHNGNQKYYNTEAIQALIDRPDATKEKLKIILEGLDQTHDLYQAKRLINQHAHELDEELLLILAKNFNLEVRMHMFLALEKLPPSVILASAANKNNLKFQIALSEFQKLAPDLLQDTQALPGTPQFNYLRYQPRLFSRQAFFEYLRQRSDIDSKLACQLLLETRVHIESRKALNKLFESRFDFKHTPINFIRLGNIQDHNIKNKLYKGLARKYLSSLSSQTIS